MTTFRATVRVDDGTLHVSRPLTAPERVGDMIDSLVYGVTDSAGADVLSVELVVETPGESDTPIADGVVGTSSTPLAPPADDDVDDEDGISATLTPAGGQS
jgi:hypothetical protein